MPSSNYKLTVRIGWLASKRPNKMGGCTAQLAVVAALLAVITGSTSDAQTTFTPSSKVARLTVYSEVDVRNIETTY